MLYGFFKKTWEYAGDLAIVATPVTVAAFAHKYIHEVGDLLGGTASRVVKDTLKANNSTLSSIVNALIDGGVIAEFFYYYQSNWNNLSRGERLVAAAMALIAVGGGIYSGTRFGIEQNTLWAGIAATGCAGLLKIVKHATNYFAEKHTKTAAAQIFPEEIIPGEDSRLINTPIAAP